MFRTGRELASRCPHPTELRGTKPSVGCQAGHAKMTIDVIEYEGGVIKNLEMHGTPEAINKVLIAVLSKLESETQ